MLRGIYGAEEERVVVVVVVVGVVVGVVYEVRNTLPKQYR